MAVSENDIALIEKYLDQSLTDEEAVDFEKRLTRSHELKFALHSHQNAIDTLREKTLLKRELKSIFEEVKQQQKTKQKISPFKFYMAAASLTILALTFGLYLFYFQSPVTGESVFTDYYQPLPTDPITRDENMAPKQLAPMELYSEKNYVAAATAFQNFITDHPQNKKAMVYLGICYINIKKYTLAEDILMQASTAKSSFTRQHAKWYLALLNLRKNKLETAKTLLKKINTGQGLYAMEAQEILDKLH